MNMKKQSINILLYGLFFLLFFLIEIHVVFCINTYIEGFENLNYTLNFYVCIANYTSNLSSMF